MFCISLFWPGMVLNQGQLSIVGSDWEPYLGSPFPSFLFGKLSLFVDVISNKRKMYADHAVIWSSSFDGRDSIMSFIRDFVELHNQLLLDLEMKLRV